MDAKTKTTGMAGNERAHHEQHAGTADFIERVRINQKRQTTH